MAPCVLSTRASISPSSGRRRGSPGNKARAISILRVDFRPPCLRIVGRPHSSWVFVSSISRRLRCDTACGRQRLFFWVPELIVTGLALLRGEPARRPDPADKVQGPVLARSAEPRREGGRACPGRVVRQNATGARPFRQDCHRRAPSGGGSKGGRRYAGQERPVTDQARTRRPGSRRPR